METIKVNMNPNPLDVQTIHASQNDGEARQWGFELHNNGDAIDSSEITDQMVFKAYKGGTEQILPENGSTPTTSPFLGDIKYPQGLLSDQEFLYRESPTEEDGNAKIKNLYGNTLVWSQSVQNGNFADTSGTGFGVVQGTVSYANNTATVVPNVSTDQPVFRINQTISVANHRMILMAETSEQIITFVAYTSGWTEIVATNDIIRVGNRNFIFFTPSSATSIHYLRFNSGLTSIAIKNVMCFDLTQMGLDITDPSEFTSLFNLPYYSYNQGTLLSFNGNGIKTVGKNLLEPPTSGSVNGVTFTVNSDGSITVNGTATSNGTYDLYRNTTVLPSWARAGETYVLSLTNIINRFDIFSYDSSGTSKSLASISGLASQTFTIPNDAVGLLVRIFVTRGVAYDVTVYPQIEFGTTPTEYEPYISNTTNIPISTYFPNGMKSAGSVYDELTESKATKKLELFEITSANIQSSYLDTQNNQWLGFVSVPNIKQITDGSAKANIICNTLETKNQGSLFGEVGNAIALLVNSTNVRITIKGITTFADMQTWLDNNPTYFIYELATPTETSFTTASLVTENTEIPLSNEDGILIGKCTEQLSENPGFIDAKIKLSDSDGECYSNKIQLHIERSPQ